MPAGRFGVLRDPRFRRYAAGQGVSLVGDGISLVALSFAVLSIGGSTTDVGVVIGAQTLGIGAFALIGGVWADRFPRRRIMIASDLVRMLVQAIVAVLLLSGHASVRSLIASALVFGCAEGVFGPSAVGLLPRIVEEGMLTSANAAISLLHTMGLVIGPVIAGFVIAASSPARRSPWTPSRSRSPSPSSPGWCRGRSRRRGLPTGSSPRSSAACGSSGAGAG